jgi:thiamine pyrophosphate-dependent acetolactate synthase large subunit-like protein
VNRGELLQRVLRVGGIDAVYGEPLNGLDVIDVADPHVAEVFALAHQRVTWRTAMVHVGDGLLVRPDLRTTNEELVVNSPDGLVALAETIGTDSGPARFRFDLELSGADADDVLGSVSPWASRPDPDDSLAQKIDAARRPVVLAGPGVPRHGAASVLNAFAAAAGIGVVNTWGAKGVLDWRSRLHFATVGLQQADFVLSGFEEADLIIATGVDPDESPDRMWRLGPVGEVDPRSLSQLADLVHQLGRQPSMPPLRAGLAAVTQDGWADGLEPLPPSRATLHYAQALGSGGLVAADAGISGYWVARTFSTLELGSAVVASRRTPGFAIACATVARRIRPWRAVLAVVDGPLEPMAAASLDEAARQNIPVAVEVWDGDGPALDATHHRDRLEGIVRAHDTKVVSVRTDVRQLASMVAVAGEIVAWRSDSPD